MTDTTVPVTTGAQPLADANTTVESIFDQANKVEPAPNEGATEPAESNEPNEAADNSQVEEAFPKKAVNAISRRDKQIGKLKAQTEQLAAELKQFREQSAPKPIQTKPDGAPKEADFTNYADYLEAVNDYKIEKRFAERDSKQQETQQSIQEKTWISERETLVAQKAQEFVKETPELASLVEEYADVVDEFSPGLQRIFLEADNAPLAFYNLAKEGKLESLATMSLAKAAMEIGRAQTQAITKPKTKAPTPLPASRGSVPAGKSLDKLSAREAHNLLSQRE